MSGGSHLPDTLQAPSAGPSFPSTGMASLMHPEVHSQLGRSDLVPMMAPSAGATAPPLLVPCVPPPLLPGHCGTNTHTDSSDDRGKKGRLRWTPELHARFVRAVEQLGGAFTATPKRILCAMALPGLTLHQVKSHVQKYRTAVATAAKGKGKGKGSRKGSHLQPAEPAAASAGPASSSEGALGAAGRNDWLEMIEDEEGLGAPASRMQASGGSPRQQQPGEQLGRIASSRDLGLPQGLWDGDDAPNLSGPLMEWGSDVLLAADPTSERPPPSQDAPAAAPLARSGSSRSGMSNGAVGGPPPAAAAPTASAAGAAAAAVSEVAQPTSPAAVMPSASTARPTPAQPGQTLLLGDGALREALRLQLEMQRQLSAALEAQRSLQEQLRAHQAYIEQLLSAGEACGEEDAPTSGNPNPCQGADVVLSPRATPQQPPQQQLQQQASQQQVQQQLQQPPPPQQVQQEAQQQRLLQQPPQQQQQPEQGQHHQHWRQQAGAPVSWQPLPQQQHSQHVGSLPLARQQPAPPAAQSLLPQSLLQPALWQQPEPDRRRQQQALASPWPASSGGATAARSGALPAAHAVPPTTAHGSAAMQEGRAWPPRASAGPCSQSGASTYTMAAVSGASSHPPGHSFQAWGGLRSSSQAAVPGHLCGPSGGPAW